MMVTFDICAGNPGALQFLMQAYDMDMFKAEQGFQRMQRAGITGARLYMLWNDCCNRDTEAAVVQPGSVICLMNRMRYCGTHAEEEPRRQQGDYCQYCGHRLREIGRERFCNNVNCQNRYVNV